MDARSKLSSIDAKIESFIPGKLVVVSAERHIGFCFPYFGK